MESTAIAEWFALAVKPRHEKSVARNLRSQGLEEFLPLYSARKQWSDRLQTVVLPLFPGYVLCQFQRTRWLQVLNTPGVMQVVGFGNRPAPVSAAEVAAVRKIVASRLAFTPWPYIQAGDRVEIRGGALDGLCGLAVREKGVDRLIVSVELLQRSVAVEIDRALLYPLPGRRAA